MAARKADAPLVIEAPLAGADSPAWRLVASFAAIGFAAGVAWPRLAGVRPGPSVPQESVASAVASATSADGVAQPAAQPAGAAVPAPQPAAPPAKAPSATPAPAAQAAPVVADAGTDAPAESAQVEWTVGIVRDEPRTGKVVARLPRGTALRVGPLKNGWYPVRYGDGFASEGWLYRGALGR
jgi:hypothetical protein